MQIDKKVFLHIALILYFCFGYSQTTEVLNDKVVHDSIEIYLSDVSTAIITARLEEALAKINLAKEISTSHKNRTCRAKTSRVLAELYYKLGDLNNAEISIENAIRIQKKENDEIALAYSYNMYALIDISLDNFEKAKKHLDQASAIIQKKDINDLKGIIHLNYGLLALATNKPEKAIIEFDKGLPVIYLLQQSHCKSTLYLNKTRALLKLNLLDKALIANDSAMKISKKFKHLEIRSESFELYSKIYEKKDDIMASLQNLKLHNRINDSLYAINKFVIAQEASSKLNLNESSNIIEELTEENSQQQESLKLGRLTTILSIALITILSLLTLSLYKNNNLRAKANELLQHKNKELILAKESVERASEAKVQFLSTITHELRTPLYAVTGLTHLLLEESPTPNQKEHLNSLKFSGEYLLSLINNILDLNKLKANKVEVENTSFNLEKRINDVLIALRKSANDRNNKVHFNFDKNIPKKIKGDSLKFSQVLINLIGNSIKFTQNGDIWIHVNLLNISDKEVLLGFEIKDNGIGISDKKQRDIFENFTQGSVQINRKFGGTGLGLSIVKNLLSLMDSKIKLESTLGEGCRFYFDLNFEIMNDESTNYKEEAKKIDYSVMIDKRVLVVEDNKINQLITRKILEKNRIICDVADNGDIAVKKARNDSFDLILMDIHMPGISGIEATKQIRKFDSEISIIALTAVTLSDNLDEFYNNGFNDIIPKPYKTEEFFTKLHKAFTLKSDHSIS